MSQIRAAFDIGSSRHKLVIARYTPHPLSNHPPTIQTILSIAERVPLADSLNSTSNIHPSTLQTSQNVVKRLLYLATKNGAQQFTAIATQVFRTANNGISHLSTLFPDTIPVTILSAHEEGQLAFESVRVLLPSSVNTDSLVVWDSGGGSTQFTQALPHFNVHALPIGAAAARSHFHIHSRDRVQQLTSWIRTVAKPMRNEQMKNKIRNGLVIGIGGSTSLFAIARDGIGKGNSFTRKQVWQLVKKIDNEQQNQETDVMAVLPKLVLLVEMMNVYDIEQVQYLPLNGSCMGLLASNDKRFWPTYVNGIRREERTINEKIMISSATDSVSKIMSENVQYTRC